MVLLQLQATTNAAPGRVEAVTNGDGSQTFAVRAFEVSCLPSAMDGELDILKLTYRNVFPLLLLKWPSSSKPLSPHCSGVAGSSSICPSQAQIQMGRAKEDCVIPV